MASIFFIFFFYIFLDFFLRIELDCRALVESRSPNIEKQRGFFLAEKNIFQELLNFSNF